MAQFSSEADKKKWESLQNSAGTSLANIVSGRATSGDFQRVTSVLNNLNGLAAQVFAQAVSAAEVQAKKFEAQYDGALRLRDNETLTAYELALNQALKQIAPDIVSDIQDAIQYGFIEQAEDLNRTLGSKFSDFEELLPPRDLPTTNDVLAANELLAEHISAVDDQKWGTREDSLVERIIAGFKSTLRDIAESVQRERAAHAAPAHGAAHSKPMWEHAQQRAFGEVPLLGAPKHSGGWEVVDDDVPALMQAHQSLLGGPQAAPNAIEALHAPTGTVASPSALPRGRDEPTISLSTRAENAITKAAEDQTNLYQQLLDFLTAESAPGGQGHGQAEDKEDEEEKADTWWRSFKNWMGDKSKKYKEFKKDNAGWLSALGSALSLMILDPTLFTKFGELIEKYVTWDNIKSAAFAAWDWVSAQAGSVVDWVMDKLNLHQKEDTIKKSDVDAVNKDRGGGVTISKDASGRTITPEQQKQMDAMDAANTDHNPNAVVNSKQGTTGNSSWQSKVANWLHFTNGADTVKVDGSDTTVQNHTNVAGSTTGGNRSSLTSNNSYQSTTAVDASPVSMPPGVMSMPPGMSSGTGLPGTFDTRNIKGTPQTGLSSFSFATGIDDSLMMMNTHYFTG
jgi:hypothetical protein